LRLTLELAPVFDGPDGRSEAILQRALADEPHEDREHPSAATSRYGDLDFTAVEQPYGRVEASIDAATDSAAARMP
jgi:hypothetical protein